MIKDNWKFDKQQNVKRDKTYFNTFWNNNKSIIIDRLKIARERNLEKPLTSAQEYKKEFYTLYKAQVDAVRENLAMKKIHNYNKTHIKKKYGMERIDYLENQVKRIKISDIDLSKVMKDTIFGNQYFYSDQEHKSMNNLETFKQLFSNSKEAYGKFRHKKGYRGSLSKSGVAEEFAKLIDEEEPTRTSIKGEDQITNYDEYEIQWNGETYYVYIEVTSDKDKEVHITESKW